MAALDLVMKEMCAIRGFRRFDGSDFYMHCVDVANFLISYGITDRDAIVGALLHDMIEDVPGYTEEGLAVLFGEKPARYVSLVSKKPDCDYHDPAILIGYLDEISADVYAAAIKTADRMHNMSTLFEAGIEKRYRKAIETETYFIPFFKQCRKRYPRYESLFQAAKTHIQPLIFEIKSHYADYCELSRLRERNEEDQCADL